MLFYGIAYIGAGLLLRHSDGATFLAIVNVWPMLL